MLHVPLLISWLRKNTALCVLDFVYISGVSFRGIFLGHGWLGSGMMLPAAKQGCAGLDLWQWYVCVPGISIIAINIR